FNVVTALRKKANDARQRTRFVFHQQGNDSTHLRYAPFCSATYLSWSHSAPPASDTHARADRHAHRGTPDDPSVQTLRASHLRGRIFCRHEYRHAHTPQPASRNPAVNVRKCSANSGRRTACPAIV